MTLDPVKAELVERIKGEIRALADGRVEAVRQAGQCAVADATNALDKVVAGYQAVVEALPLDLLGVVMCGGALAISEWKDTMGHFHVAFNGCSDPESPKGLTTTIHIPKGDYKVILVVLPVKPKK